MFLLFFFLRLIDSRTLLWKLTGLAEPLEPLSTDPLLLEPQKFKNIRILNIFCTCCCHEFNFHMMVICTLNGSCLPRNFWVSTMLKLHFKMHHQALRWGSFINYVRDFQGKWVWMILSFFCLLGRSGWKSPKVHLHSLWMVPRLLARSMSCAAQQGDAP